MVGGGGFQATCSTPLHKDLKVKRLNSLKRDLKKNAQYRLFLFIEIELLKVTYSGKYSSINGHTSAPNN